MPTLPLAALESFDETMGYKMHLTSPGKGHVTVETAAAASPPPTDSESLSSNSWTEVASRLVDTFLAHTAPILPIVSHLEAPQAPSQLSHAMSAVSAARSNVPSVVFDTLRGQVQRELDENGEFLS